MLYAIVAVIALILDQALKYWTTVNIVVNTGVKKLIPGVIHLANVHNTGAAFSFLEGARWFFVILCLVFVAVVIYVLAKDIIRTPVARWMAVLVLAGAVGNCIDRIITGYVVDMFEFEFMTFPVFNFADILITLGGIAFCLCILFEKEDKEEKSPAAKGTESAAPAKRSAPARSAAAPKRRSLHKTPIPDFPRHERVQEPGIDPNDPFAEWERRAAATQQPKTAPAPETAMEVELPAEPAEPVPAPVRQPAPAHTAEKKPAPAHAAEKPSAPVHAAAKKPAPPVSSPAPAAKAEPAKAPAPKAPGNTADLEEMCFDLDDILAEFKDL